MEICQKNIFELQEKFWWNKSWLLFFFALWSPVTTVHYDSRQTCRGYDVWQWQWSSFQSLAMTTIQSCISVSVRCIQWKLEVKIPDTMVFVHDYVSHNWSKNYLWREAEEKMKLRAFVWHGNDTFTQRHTGLKLYKKNLKTPLFWALQSESNAFLNVASIVQGWIKGNCCIGNRQIF